MTNAEKHAIYTSILRIIKSQQALGAAFISLSKACNEGDKVGLPVLSECQSHLKLLDASLSDLTMCVSSVASLISDDEAK